ncbi:oxygen-independent coproporphyrinogen III oxidase [Pontiellaceae bacterium B1224]|nr:oxygen-independent coproporphyrinogen III oxidase [Pontiellaceae bacterium B1224]
MSKINVHLDQLKKYDQAGPRYTSYPPATHFTEDFQVSNLKPPASPAPLSLYFHLPFCSMQCLYCGCTNIVTGDSSKSAQYLSYLEKELKLRAALIHPDSEVVQIQLGGGTPTFFQPAELKQLGELIRQYFPVAETVEAGVEIDPRSLTKDKVLALRDAGFNRASLGVQDTCGEVQKSINRIQSLELISEANEWLRDSGFDSVNFDLIYGLPKQSLKTFGNTLDDSLFLSPDRFAIYSYAHIPWVKPFQKSFEKDLPDPELKMRLLQLTIERLTDAGYVYIGMDHFARPDDSMAQALAKGTLQRNFQGYSTHKGVDLHGFGMSAISHAGGCYFQNTKELEPYYTALNAGSLPIIRGYKMTADDRIRYQAIMHIMCNLYIDYATLSAELGIDFTDYFKVDLASLDDLETDGLLQREEAGLRVTPLGRLFIRIIAMRFDAYLQNENRKGRYSQTV